MEDEVIDDAADEAAFNDGASGKAGNTVPTATPEPTQPADDTPAVVAPRYAQITEDELNDLRARSARIDEIRATQEKSFGTAFGKIGGIERVLQQLQATPGELSEDDFSELKEQFPELAEMQVKGLNRALAKIKGIGVAAVDPAKVDELVREGVSKTLEQIESNKRTEEVKTLDTEHPDWRDIVAKPEFKAWKDTQPTRFQKAFDKTWDAGFLSEAFDNFKTAAAKAKATPAPVVQAASTRKDRLAAAVNPRGTGGHAAGPSDDDEFMSGFKSG